MSAWAPSRATSSTPTSTRRARSPGSDSSLSAIDSVYQVVVDTVYRECAGRPGRLRDV
ncbi:hypothetical protein [Streptomyces sp. NBC_00076]|uniref:hypothetical protein n=1 Tax=Streptomyces sp. NBC_00076 TaxID=2975642 RepID=UPI0038660589